jgi:hypothetical protein
MPNLITTDKAVVTVTRDGDEYRATLTANHKSWTGVGLSAALAIKTALVEVANENWRKEQAN